MTLIFPLCISLSHVKVHRQFCTWLSQNTFWKWRKRYVVVIKSQWEISSIGLACDHVWEGLPCCPDGGGRLAHCGLPHSLTWGFWIPWRLGPWAEYCWSMLHQVFVFSVMKDRGLWVFAMAFYHSMRDRWQIIQLIWWPGSKWLRDFGKSLAFIPDRQTDQVNIFTKTVDKYSCRNYTTSLKFSFS